MIHSNIDKRITKSLLAGNYKKVSIRDYSFSSKKQIYIIIENSKIVYMYEETNEGFEEIDYDLLSMDPQFYFDIQKMKSYFMGYEVLRE